MDLQESMDAPLQTAFDFACPERNQTLINILEVRLMIIMQNLQTHLLALRRTVLIKKGIEAY
jgi:hypothetical protein